MIKKITVIILSIFFSSCLNAQENQSYKDCIKEFYSLLFSEKKVSVSNLSKLYANDSPSYEIGLIINSGKLKVNDESILKYQNFLRAHSDTIESKVFQVIKKYMLELTQGLNYESICKQIELSSVINEGYEFSMLLELKLTEKSILYFELNRDSPKQIQYIWLSSGRSLGDLVQGTKTVEKLKRPGIINDPDGYVNLREKPAKNSRIIGKLVRNEVFYYIQTNETDWWLVYRDEGGKQIGYIHKSRIRKYSEFSLKQKESVRMRRGGC